MKQIITLCLGFLFIVGTTNISAQDLYTEEDGKNEIKLNLFYGVLEILELHYERVLNGAIGVGISGSYHFDEFSDFDALLLPYLRFYPSKSRRAEGFFIEANTGLMLTNEERFILLPNGNSIIEDDTQTNFGFGVAVGGKFVSRSGFTGEVYLGLGRVFGDQTSFEAYPRAGINFGYRF